MMTSGGRFLMILFATVFSVVMLFASLVAQVLHRLSEVSEETFLP
jgi:hypothetical protein